MADFKVFPLIDADVTRIVNLAYSVGGKGFQDMDEDETY